MILEIDFENLKAIGKRDLSAALDFLNEALPSREDRGYVIGLSAALPMLEPDLLEVAVKGFLSTATDQNEVYILAEALLRIENKRTDKLLARWFKQHIDAEYLDTWIDIGLQRNPKTFLPVAQAWIEANDEDTDAICSLFHTLFLSDSSQRMMDWALAWISLNMNHPAAPKVLSLLLHSSVDTNDSIFTSARKKALSWCKKNTSNEEAAQVISALVTYSPRFADSGTVIEWLKQNAKIDKAGIVFLAQIRTNPNVVSRRRLVGWLQNNRGSIYAAPLLAEFVKTGSTFAKRLANDWLESSTNDVETAELLMALLAISRDGELLPSVQHWFRKAEKIKSSNPKLELYRAKLLRQILVSGFADQRMRDMAQHWIAANSQHPLSVELAALLE